MHDVKVPEAILLGVENGMMVVTTWDEAGVPHTIVFPIEILIDFLDQIGGDNGCEDC